VIAEQAGLTIVNPFRDHHVPWAAIQAVDTGDWVRVHYLPGSTAASRPGSTVASRPASSAASRAISCWALYISARTKRRSGRFPGGAGPAAKRWPGGLPNPRLPGSSDPAGAAGRPGARSGSRLPEEAKYLASLPAAQAIAVSLDTRAGRERTRAARSDPGGLPHPVTARWAWAPVAAVVLPALALLIVAVALGP
jgi:hypothetical protein